MTELAYLAEISDAYVRTFRARVVSLPPGGVVLDRTYFYPTGGGQPSDRGFLVLNDGGRLEVVDVSKSGPSVIHRVKGPAAVLARLVAGAEVEGSIDWPRRLMHMRLHSAQHLLSARVFARTGRRTRKANLTGNRAILELDGPVPAELLGPLAEDLAAALDAPREVSIRRVPRADWDRNPASERSGLVPLPAHVDPVRVVEINGLDVCPCGGTHVRSTGELGRVTLLPPVALPDGASRLELRLEETATPGPSG
ncbi:MAG: alanyl-tRNA editing protein [Thermoplasmata archaeon]